MAPLRLFSFLVLILSVILSTGYAQEIRASEQQPSSTIPAQHDIDIMAKEIQWGMQEMHRYKNYKGQWPYRADSSSHYNSSGNSEDSQDDDEVPDKETKLRGKNGRSRPSTPEAHYWEKLVTVF
jgi:hypothetical protein